MESALARAELKLQKESYTAFQTAFTYKQERTNSKAQYILRHLENEERRLASKTGESLNLTVEHVLPKNPGNAWKAEIQQDETIAGECVYRLGNLCLLTAAENKDVANSSFQKKKTVYAKSEIILTQKIFETLAWSRERLRSDKHAWLSWPVPSGDFSSAGREH